jgi:hypothetical protein
MKLIDDFPEHMKNKASARNQTNAKGNQLSRISIHDNVHIQGFQKKTPGDQVGSKKLH